MIEYTIVFVKNYDVWIVISKPIGYCTLLVFKVQCSKEEKFAGIHCRNIKPRLLCLKLWIESKYLLNYLVK